MFVQAKDREREEARRLRATGVGVRAIAVRLGVSLASASVWTRDVAPPAAEPPKEEAEPAAEAERETRRCGRCRETLPVSAFNRAGEGRQHWCRARFREYFAARGDGHRRAVKAARARRREAARRHLRAFLEASSCADCGEDELLVLELDHHRGAKRASISALVNGGPSIAKLDEELAWCEVVCVNWPPPQDRAPRRLVPRDPLAAVLLDADAAPQSRAHPRDPRRCRMRRLR